MVLRKKNTTKKKTNKQKTTPQVDRLEKKTKRWINLTGKKPGLFHLSNHFAGNSYRQPVSHLFGSSNYIRSHSGLGSLFLLYVLLFSQPIQCSFPIGAWRSYTQTFVKTFLYCPAHDRINLYLGGVMNYQVKKQLLFQSAEFNEAAVTDWVQWNPVNMTTVGWQI